MSSIMCFYSWAYSLGMICPPVKPLAPRACDEFERIDSERVKRSVNILRTRIFIGFIWIGWLFCVFLDCSHELGNIKATEYILIKIRTGLLFYSLSSTFGPTLKVSRPKTAKFSQIKSSRNHLGIISHNFATAPSCWCVQLSGGQGWRSGQPRQQAMKCASHDSTTWASKCLKPSAMMCHGNMMICTFAFKVYTVCRLPENL